MRKKVLYFTFTEPSITFGGGIGILKSLSVLCELYDVYYVGPHYSIEDCGNYGLKIHETAFIELNSSAINRLKNLILHSTASGFYSSWKKTVKTKWKEVQFDFVYVEGSMHAFACKYAYDSHLPLIVMTHNVELDYTRRMNPKGLNRITRTYNARINETKSLGYADKVIALTNNDKERFEELYNITSSKITVVPVCVNEVTSDDIYLNNGKRYIMLPGSLWFGPNADGAKWFIENVWENAPTEITEKLDLVVVGSNPNPDIKQVIEKTNDVKLIENPPTMTKYFNGALAVVAPIFYGAGMKVKIAESMSYGNLIITTTHAFKGYEAASGLLFLADDKSSYLNNIKMVLSMSENELQTLNSKIKQCFIENYSMGVFLKKIEETINGVINPFAQ